MQVGDKVYNYWVSHLENEPENILSKPVEEGAAAAAAGAADLFTPLSDRNHEIQWSKNGTYMIEIFEDGF